VVLAAAACSSEDDSSGGSSYKLPERSETCKSWQKSECDWLVDTCNSPGLDRASCDAQFGGLFCKGDSTMQKCVDALGSAACGTTPDACTGVADSAPAVAYCKELVARICQRSAACGDDDPQCAPTLTSALNCSAAIGVKAAGPQCLQDVPSIPCENPSLPDSCKGVLLTDTATASLHTTLPTPARRLDVSPAIQHMVRLPAP